MHADTGAIYVLGMQELVKFAGPAADNLNRRPLRVDPGPVSEEIRNLP